MNTTETTKRPLVFISHSSKDKSAAGEIAIHLRDSGLDVWFDEEQIGLGKSIPTAISDGLSRADVILLLVSTHFATSRWCRAEYESLLMAEIESERTTVIAVRLDDTELPMLLRAKRYIDARRGFDRDTFTEFAEKIAEGVSFTRFERLVPAKPIGYGESVLAMVISSTLREFPIEALAREPLLQGASLLKLYSAIDTLIERFHDLCEEIVQALMAGGIVSGEHQSVYGSAYQLGEAGIRSANRKLARIAADMRDIAAGFDDILANDSPARQRFSDLSRICASISVGEDFLVILFGAPVTLPGTIPSDREEWGLETGRLACVDRHDSWDNSRKLDEYSRVSSELDSFRVALRQQIARLASTPQSRDEQ